MSMCVCACICKYVCILVCKNAQVELVHWSSATRAEMPLHLNSFHAAYNMPVFGYPCWNCPFACDCVLFVSISLTYHEPSETCHPSTQLTHRGTPGRAQERWREKGGWGDSCMNVESTITLINCAYLVSVGECHWLECNSTRLIDFKSLSVSVSCPLGRKWHCPFFSAGKRWMCGVAGRLT